MVNPGHIKSHRQQQDWAVEGDTECDDLPMPCLLFFDSLKAHDASKIQKKIRKWLNCAWNEREGEAIQNPFTAKTMKLLQPIGAFAETLARRCVQTVLH